MHEFYDFAVNARGSFGTKLSLMRSAFPLGTLDPNLLLSPAL